MNSLAFHSRRALAGATVGALVLLSASATAAPPVPSDAEAQQAHAKGACGQLGPGTGCRGALSLGELVIDEATYTVRLRGRPLFSGARDFS